MSNLVDCYSGSEYAERPTALHWQDQCLVVTEILARWRIPNAKCFVVRTENGQTFELVYAEVEGTWSIRPVGNPGFPGARGNQTE